jgi:hypothetical protein
MIVDKGDRFFLVGAHTAVYEAELHLSARIPVATRMMLLESVAQIRSAADV